MLSLAGSVVSVVAARAGQLVGAAALLLTACDGGSEAASVRETSQTGASAEVAVAVSATATSEPVRTTREPTTTRRPTTTKPESTGRDQSCVVTVEPGDSLSAIASANRRVTLDALLEENRIGVETVLHPGDELDVCIGNDVDDVTGASLLPPSPRAVREQQRRLNELFRPYSIAELAVDGDSGPLTRQMLCAARLGLGLRVSTAHVSEDSPEEQAIFEAESLSIPDGAATWAGRWILIDSTCQVMFTGEGDQRIVDVFPTSTGEPGYETRPVQGVAAFRYDPALDNGGWHDSSAFPTAVDDPLNGNMYKPLYFSNGQAIHGANYVPPTPASKGCARMFTWHQDRLLDWLGLDDVTELTWRRDRIGVTVSVQGSHRPLS